MSARRSDIVEENLRIIRWYAEEYVCSLDDSFNDWVGEGPMDDWLVNALRVAVQAENSEPKRTEFDILLCGGE